MGGHCCGGDDRKLELAEPRSWRKEARATALIPPRQERQLPGAWPLRSSRLLAGQNNPRVDVTLASGAMAVEDGRRGVAEVTQRPRRARTRAHWLPVCVGAMLLAGCTSPGTPTASSSSSGSASASAGESTTGTPASLRGQIAFAHDATFDQRHEQIYLERADGSNVRQLVHSGASDVNPALSPTADGWCSPGTSIRGRTGSSWSTWTGRGSSSSCPRTAPISAAMRSTDPVGRRTVVGSPSPERSSTDTPPTPPTSSCG